MAAVTNHLRARHSHVTVLGGVFIHAVLFCLGLYIFLHTVQGRIGNYAGDRYRMPNMRRKFDTVALDFPSAAVLRGEIVLISVASFLKPAGKGPCLLVGCFLVLCAVIKPAVPINMRNANTRIAILPFILSSDL